VSSTAREVDALWSRSAESRNLSRDSLSLTCAQKKGEVVGPAGGETGVPRGLAEACKLLGAANYL